MLRVVNQEGWTAEQRYGGNLEAALDHLCRAQSFLGPVPSTFVNASLWYDISRSMATAELHLRTMIEQLEGSAVHLRITVPKTAISDAYTTTITAESPYSPKQTPEEKKINRDYNILSGISSIVCDTGITLDRGTHETGPRLEETTDAWVVFGTGTRMACERAVLLETKVAIEILEPIDAPAPTDEEIGAALERARRDTRSEREALRKAAKQKPENIHLD